MMVPTTALEPSLSIVPANDATCHDLTTLFGARGASSSCQCQRYKLRPGEAFRSFPVEERMRRLHEQTDCGHPESDTTSGLVAYLEREPVGWRAVEPRPEYEGLLRVFRVPWDGRDEDRTDDGVWAVTCLFGPGGLPQARGEPGTGPRRRRLRPRAGRSRDRGVSDHRDKRHAEELHVGTPSVFADAGLVEVSRPTVRRLVMRLDF